MAESTKKTSNEATATMPKYTLAEQRVRQHPHVAKFISREPVCAAILASPSIRIWAPAVSENDTEGLKATRHGTNNLLLQTLKSPDKIDQLILFWDEKQPQLVPQSLVAMIGDKGPSDSSGHTKEPLLMTGEGSAFALSAAHGEAGWDKGGHIAQTGAPEVLDTLNALVIVGDKLSGWKSVVHGGIVATIFDEITGYMPMVNRMRGVPLFVSAGYMTGYLNIRYHRPVPTSAVLLVTAKITRIQGRKCFLEGQMRNISKGGPEGPVLASCEALFISLTTNGPQL